MLGFHTSFSRCWLQWGEKNALTFTEVLPTVFGCAVLNPAPVPACNTKQPRECLCFEMYSLTLHLSPIELWQTFTIQSFFSLNNLNPMRNTFATTRSTIRREKKVRFFMQKKLVLFYFEFWFMFILFLIISA